MSPNKKLSQTAATSLSQSPVPTEFLLSLATGPLLLGIVSTCAVFSWLEDIGVASEELFRGDRLPVLHFPNPGEEDSDS